MGVSIYYSARRGHGLSPAEQSAIERAANRYPLESLVRECGMAVSDFRGEAFSIYTENEPDVILEGATKLPLDSEEVFFMAVQYWCRLLSEIRRTISDSEWRVRVDDADVPWCAERRMFDPTV